MTRTARILAVLVGTGVLILGWTTASRAAGEPEIVATCEGCHGKNGVSTQPEVPTIAGYGEQYILDSLVVYKNEVRHCPESNPAMCMVAKGTSDVDARAAAKYFAAQRFVRAKQTFDAKKAQVGRTLHERHCNRCHDIDPGGRHDYVGIILAGQWMPYLRYTFAEFTSGKRLEPAPMKHKVDKLDQGEIDALVNYYGSFQ